FSRRSRTQPHCPNLSAAGRGYPKLSAKCIFSTNSHDSRERGLQERGPPRQRPNPLRFAVQAPRNLGTISAPFCTIFSGFTVRFRCLSTFGRPNRRFSAVFRRYPKVDKQRNRT